MLYSGVTTVRDMAGDARILAGYARDANNDEIPSPDLYYSALMAGATFFTDPRTATSTKGGANGGMPYMKAITDTTNIALAVAEAKGSGATGIKLYANLPATLVNKVLNEAKKQNIPVWSHAWKKAGPEFWNKNLPSLDDLFTQMKQQHTILDATLLTYKKWATSDTSMRWDYEIAKRIALRAHTAGVPICAGTDDDQEQLKEEGSIKSSSIERLPELQRRKIGLRLEELAE